jgi:hypothetical protein
VSQIRVFKGMGNATFSQVASFAVAPGEGGVVGGDFNGDGHLDIAWASSSASSSIGVALTNMMGQWLAPNAIAVSVPDGLAMADFDRDGRLDLLTATYGVTFMRGKLDGTFEAPITFSSGADTTHVVPGDLNEDGKLDAVVSRGASLLVFLNTLP